MPNRWQAIIWTNDGLVFWRIYASLGLNELKSGSHSEAPFNLFHAPLTICLGSLLWSTPLQNSLISVKISRAGECLPHSLNARALFPDVYNGNPLKGGLLILWQIPIHWFSFFCSNDCMQFVSKVPHALPHRTCRFCSTAHSVVIWMKIYTVLSTSWRS